MQAAENVLGSETKLAIEDAVRGHEGRPGSLLGILERVQQADPHRFLSIALFNLTPQGDNVISVCRGTACHTRSSRDLLERLCFELGLGGDDVHALSDADKLSLTTQDRKFTIRTVACFGQCALAPVVEINHQILSHVNERTLQREVKALTQGRP